MWDAEKRLRAVSRAIDREMSRTGGSRVTSHMQEVYEKVQSEHPVEEYEHELIRRPWQVNYLLRVVFCCKVLIYALFL